MSSKQPKSCLVITYGPVPTPQNQTIEGGGMRAWGLARGLKAHGIEVTIGVNAGFPQELSSHQGIRLVNWDMDQQFADLINSFDAVIISYCMGAPSVFVANHINEDVQLILDAYVPIYIEVSARESDDIDSEYQNYRVDFEGWNHVLKRGDYFLCANETQKDFYAGILSALGIINPYSYSEQRVLVVPFGIHEEVEVSTRNPYEKLGIKQGEFVVLWFGGLYPWFRVEELLDSILALTKFKDMKFVIVGGKNPFNLNPDLAKQYEKAESFAGKHRLLGKSLFFVEWVDFDDRINWYKHANLVISINNPGEENKYSWRTRVMDYVWGEAPTLTNGGDPLSEQLLDKKAAIKLNSLSAEELTKTIGNLYKNRELISTTKNNIKRIKPTYYWQNIIEPVSNAILGGHKPFKKEHFFKEKIGFSETSRLASAFRMAPPSSKVKRYATLPIKVISHARRKGLRRTAKLGINILRTQVKARSPLKTKQYVFISHEIDNTGAPQVLLQMIEEFAKKHGARQIHLVAPHIVSNQLRRLRSNGIKVDKAAVMGSHLMKLQLALAKDDFVLLNTVAIYDNYRDFILQSLRNQQLNHAFWFIHEDKAQLRGIAPRFMDTNFRRELSSLIKKGRLTILVPSQKIKHDYDELLKTDKVVVIPLKVDVEDKYKKPRAPSDYKKVDFLISGSPSDGRKGQLTAIAAFQEFLNVYYEKNPGLYRDFSLNLVGVGEDYVSQQVRSIGKSVLGPRIKIYPSLPLEDAHEISSRCNAVISCSLNETFGLSVAEGMFMGHVVFRNNTAGVDEQLKDGVNGYLVNSEDIKQFAQVLEKALNKKATPDYDLQAMGAASQKMIASFAQHSYLEPLEALEK